MEEKGKPVKWNEAQQNAIYPFNHPEMLEVLHPMLPPHLSISALTASAIRTARSDKAEMRRDKGKSSFLPLSPFVSKVSASANSVVNIVVRVIILFALTILAIKTM